MCNYCNDIEIQKNQDIRYIDEKHRAYLYYWKCCNEYSLDIDFRGVELSSISIDIKFCPMCGRKL